jgi:hypothetical protein
MNFWIIKPKIKADVPKEISDRFKGKSVDLTPAQIKYINVMFEKKGPVLVRMGVRKKTRFFGLEEWDKEKKKYYFK